MKFTTPLSPKAARRRAALVAAHLELNAIYLLASGKLARYCGLSDDGLEFMRVDAHRALDVPHGQFCLSAANAAQARLAYSAQAWAQRNLEHMLACQRQQREEGASWDAR